MSKETKELTVWVRLAGLDRDLDVRILDTQYVSALWRAILAAFPEELRGCEATSLDVWTPDATGTALTDASAFLANVLKHDDEGKLRVYVVPTKETAVAKSETDAKFERILQLLEAQSKLLEAQSNSGRKQGAMRAAVMARDKQCVVTGNKDLAQLDCAHIVGLNQIHGVPGLPEDKYYDPSVGIALEKNLRSSFDNDEWYFQPDGTIVLCNVKRREPLKLPPRIKNMPSGLDPNVLKFKAELAERRRAISCALCWKQIGDVNFDDHYERSCCENPDRTAPTALGECESGQSNANTTQNLRGKKQHRIRLAKQQQLQPKKPKIAGDEDDNKTA